jgi:hypothetical protein
MLGRISSAKPQMWLPPVKNPVSSLPLHFPTPETGMFKPVLGGVFRRRRSLQGASGGVFIQV